MTDLLDAPPEPPAPRRTPARRVLPSGARGQSAGRTIVVGALSFFLAALLNSETLHEMAERQPFGWERDVAMGVTGGLHTVAHWTFLDRPGEWFDDARGLNHDAPIDLEDLVASATTVPPPTTAPAPPPATTLSPPGATDPAASVPPVPTTGPVATTTPPETAPTTTVPQPIPLRIPTGDDPLRVLVMGDSMAQGFGMTFERYLTNTGVMVPSSFYKTSSGLTRPDYFDWPAQIAAQTTEKDPEVVVLMFGANDPQKIKLDGHIYGVGDQQWQDEYRRRVAAVMDFLVNSGKRVIWVGLPAMERSDLDSDTQVLDHIFREEAAKRPSVSYTETRSLFANADGVYAAYLPNDDGEPKLMRTQDGVHFTLAGAARMSKAVMATLQSMLPPPPTAETVPTTTTPPVTVATTVPPPTVPATTVAAPTTPAETVATTVPAPTVPAATVPTSVVSAATVPVPAVPTGSSPPTT